MGFFSWQCAKSEKPVMAEVAVRGSNWEFASDVVVLFKNGDRITGIYDGYGRVNGFELVDLPEDRWRMVIEKYYYLIGENISLLGRFVRVFCLCVCVNYI